MQVLVVDDEPLYREAIAGFCREALGESEAVATAGDRDRAEAAFPLADVVFLDLKLDGTGSLALDLVKKVAASGKRVAVMSGEYGESTMALVQSHGAIAFIPKNHEMSQVRLYVQVILGGGTYWPTTLKDAPAVDPAVMSRLKMLSPREQELCQLVAEGLGNKEIGIRRGIAADTVKKQLKQVYAKLGVDRVDLIKLFAR